MEKGRPDGNSYLGTQHDGVRATLQKYRICPLEPHSNVAGMTRLQSLAYKCHTCAATCCTSLHMVSTTSFSLLVRASLCMLTVYSYTNSFLVLELFSIQLKQYLSATRLPFQMEAQAPTFSATKVSQNIPFTSETKGLERNMRNRGTSVNVLHLVIDGLERYAQTMHEAIQEVRTRNGTRIPFYLTVTIDCFAFLSFVTVLYFMSILPDPKDAKLRLWEMVYGPIMLMHTGVNLRMLEHNSHPSGSTSASSPLPSSCMRYSSNPELQWVLNNEKNLAHLESLIPQGIELEQRLAMYKSAAQSQLDHVSGME